MLTSLNENDLKEFGILCSEKYVQNLVNFRH